MGRRGRAQRDAHAGRPEPLERRQGSVVGAAAGSSASARSSTTICRAIAFAMRRSFCAGVRTSGRGTAATTSSRSPRPTSSRRYSLKVLVGGLFSFSLSLFVLIVAKFPHSDELRFIDHPWRWRIGVVHQCIRHQSAPGVDRHHGHLDQRDSVATRDGKWQRGLRNRSGFEFQLHVPDCPAPFLPLHDPSKYGGSDPACSDGTRRSWAGAVACQPPERARNAR